MKKLLAALCIGLSFYVTAQDIESEEVDTAWKTGVSINLNLTQVSLTKWVGGGVNSVAFAGNVGAFANYKKGKHSWNNRIGIAYGMIRQDDFETWRKSDDQITFISRYGYEFAKHWSIVGYVDFQTQMDVGYEYGTDSTGSETRKFISRFMSPGYLISNVGLEYAPSENFKMTIAPLGAGKTTFVLDDDLSDAGAFGVDPGKHVRYELGANFNLYAKKEIMENISIETLLNLFQNYQTPEEIDVDWRVLLELKVNKLVNVTFATHMIYDADVDIAREDGTTGPDTQFKQVLAVGFGYSLKNH